MMSAKKIIAAAALPLMMAAFANSAQACAMCSGKTDSPLAVAMNWGILSLLVVVVGVLGAIASFFIYLARRAAAAPPPPMPKDQYLPETNKA
jgi:hypothetical protein